MSRRLDGFVGALLGSDFLRDYQHASRLFVADFYRLAPKFSNLFHVVFRFNQPYNLGGNQSRELNLLVKDADLPKFDFDIKEYNQYNKKSYAVTKINYQEVRLSFHDDSANIVNKFWTDYMKYYIVDSNLSKDYFIDDVVKDVRSQGNNNWGVRAQDDKHFLKAIEIYSLSQHRFTQYVLMYPWIKSFSHGSHNYEQSAIMENTMQINYQGVLYGKGKIVKNGAPAGFADLIYDFTPSPLLAGNNSLLGPNGVLDQGLGVLDDITSGNISMSTILNGARVVRNASSISKAGLKEELKQGTINTARGSTNNPINRYEFPGTITTNPTNKVDRNQRTFGPSSTM